MPLLPRLSSLWRNLFHKSRTEQELTEEIDTYLEMLVEEKIKDGLDPAEARCAALIELGGKGRVKEKVRDARLGHQLETLWRDLRYGLHMLGRNPGFTAVAVLSLALGIGANTAIFSLLDAVLFKMLPVKNPEQLFFLEWGNLHRLLNQNNRGGIGFAFFERLRSERETLAGVCNSFGRDRIIVAVDGQPEIAYTQQISGSCFAVLGVNALLGRNITEEDDRVLGAHPVVVISYNYWKRRFAGDPAIVGKSITVNGHPFTIIGVAPRDFFGVRVGDAPDLWTPIMMEPQIAPDSSTVEKFDYPVGGLLFRLKPNVTEQQASAVLSGHLRQSAAELDAQLPPDWQQSLRQQIRPARGGSSRLREQFSEPLRILMVVVGLILLIACANVANLLLARATARKKEIAIRLALGAGRLRLIRQLLTESMLLAGAGGALGLFFAWWGSNFLLALFGGGHNPVFINLKLDARVLGFTAVISLLSGILFGLVPAWLATRVDVTPALKESVRSSGAGSRLGWGKTLVVAQVALSLLLLIGAGLFVRSLEKLKSLDAGFNQENVLLVSTNPLIIGYQKSQIPDIYQRILERIKAIPGVRSASLSFQGLLSNHGSGWCCIRMPGRSVRPQENTLKGFDSGTTPFIVVGPEYFETVGMTILRGRGFTGQDNKKAPTVAVVNESFARHYFGGEDPMGKLFFLHADLEIVGVVNDAKYDSLREQSLPTFYVSYLQEESYWRETTFQIRAAANPTHIIAAVRQAVWEVDPNLPLYDIKTLAAQVDESLMQERLIGKLSSFFGLLALLLAAIGLYGVMAYAVGQRTHEIGVRMALGAHRGAVMRMVLRQGMKLVLIGAGFGLSVSFAVTRIIANQLFDVTPTDPMTFVGAPLLLLIVALLACFAPARRATKVDPLVALRCE